METLTTLELLLITLALKPIDKSEKATPAMKKIAATLANKYLEEILIRDPDEVAAAFQDLAAGSPEVEKEMAKLVDMFKFLKSLNNFMRL